MGLPHTFPPPILAGLVVRPEMSPNQPKRDQYVPNIGLEEQSALTQEDESSRARHVPPINRSLAVDLLNATASAAAAQSLTSSQ